MPEIRIKIPDLAAGKRLLDATKDNVPGVRLWQARQLVQETNERLQESSDLLEAAHAAASEELCHLGEAELAAYDGPIRTFVALFERLKNVDLSDLELEAAPEFVREYEIDVRDVDFGAVDSFKVLAAGGAAGAAAGFTSLAAVGTFATASTGTAISSLSGAAATNATLAWLGGGSIASGGGGMAAGTVVLGGIVALPVLAIGGLVLHHKGRKALADAQADTLQAEVVLEDMRMARTAALGIRLRAKQIASLVTKLSAMADRRNDVLQHIIDRNDDYATYEEHDRKAVMLAATVAKTLRAVIDVPVINEDGTLTRDSRLAVAAAKELLVTHGSVT